ncbi:MAG TPA: acyloxyacyl hydrolase [Terracidiphilus sp.]
MTRIVKLFALVLMAGTMIAAAAQTTGGPATPGPVAVSPVAQVRDARSWEFGPFVSGGIGVGDRSDYRFLSAGVQLGKPLTPVLHAGVFSGQFELGGNIMPLWQSYTPAPHTATFTCIEAGQPVSCVLPVAGGTYNGVSLTPVIFRWNILTKSTRFQPWFQGAGGLIYTTRQYPPSFSSTPSFPVDGSTSVWNFTPQGGVGFHYFIFPKRSIDVGLNAVHISSASLGDRNPGVNASIQVQVGLTRWR